MKDFIKMQGLTINALDRVPSKIEDAFAHPDTIRVHISNPVASVEIKAPADLNAVTELAALARHQVEIYIVRAGPSMAALGLELIKEAFSYGLNAEDHENFGAQIHDLIGRRILTKVEEKTFVYGLEGDTAELRINDVAVCTAGPVFAHVGPYVRNFLFEKTGRRVLTLSRADHAAHLDSAHFDALRVRPATPEQIAEYLTLKFEYEKSNKV